MAVPDGIPNSHLYVDGGTVYNYPINAFDDATGVNRNTLGFYFSNSQHGKLPEDLQQDHLYDFSRAVYQTVLNAQVVNFLQDPEEVKRSVKIDDFGYAATDLSLNDADFERLFQSGFDSVNAHFNPSAHSISKNKKMNTKALESIWI